MVGFVGSVVAARSLRPVEMGIMQTLLLIPAYCSFLHLGVFNGLSRDIALHQGKEDHGTVQRIVNSSWWTAKIVAVFGLVIGGVFAGFYWIGGYPHLYLFGMIFVLVNLIAEPLSQHLEIVYLSSRKFRSLGVRLLWQNAVTFLGNLLPLRAGAAGFVAARGVYSASRLAFRWTGVPIKASAPGKMKEVCDLAKIGMPLLVAGALYTFMGVADRSVVACFMTPKDVGYFSLAGIVVAGIQFLPSCLATLLYPRVAACYGRTGSPRSLRRYFWILLVTNVAILAPICLIGYFLVEPVTRHYLPKYIDGIPAAKLACLSSLTLAYFGVTCIIAVVRRNAWYIAAIAASLLLIWLLGGYLVHHGYGIVGAVWARTVATGLLCIFTIAFAFRLTAERGSN